MKDNLNPAWGHVASEAALATGAARAVAAVVEAGAAILIAEPWRIARIVRDADDMTEDELGAEIARRRSAGPPADMNRAIAFAQLALAMKAPKFGAAWAAWRSGRDRTIGRAESFIICLPETDSDCR